MYVTRPLSLYKTNPEALSLPPPEGPNGGYLVLQDDASTARTFFGFEDTKIKDHPFPQNKLHVVTHGSGEDKTHYPVYFLPAINRPLSSNIYYAIKTQGSNKGKACASSTDEEMTPCCFGNCVNDVQPRPLDPADIYQQFQVSIHRYWHSSGFLATSVASDGHPPSFIRREGWRLDSKTPRNFSLGEAAGLDPGLRARLPDFNFPLSNQASRPIVVGKWYSPFMFIKEYLMPRDQVKKSMYYEVTLEQQWERVFFLENEHAGSSSDQGSNTVFVDITVPTESVAVAETDAIQDRQDNSMVWFYSVDGAKTLGLSSLVVRRMMWEEERAGWAPKAEKEEKVSKIEEFGGVGSWANYGCYMLVERFVFKRMDGTVVLSYRFNHTNQIRSKWE